MTVNLNATYQQKYLNVNIVQPQAQQLSSKHRITVNEVKQAHFSVEGVQSYTTQ